MTPLRIQLRRTKGWRKPPNTIVCSRPGRWGNPWSVKNVEILTTTPRGGIEKLRDPTHEDCVQIFRDDLLSGEIGLTVEDVRRELANHNLACWCRLCDRHRDGKPLDVACPECAPCHCDVYGELLYG